MGKNGSRGRSRKRKVPLTNSAGYKADHDYSAVVPSNPKMEAYYSYLGLHSTRQDERSTGSFVECHSDEEKLVERDSFLASIRSILPAAFRIDRSLDSKLQQTLLDELQQFVGTEMELEIQLPRKSAPFGGMKNILDNGHLTVHTGEMLVKKRMAPARPIAFLDPNSPRALGYQLAIDRNTLRRNSSLQPFYSWLKIQTDCGHITRQETVSMIPPVVLDVQQGMTVLDMCAAPGSKTCQLVEIVGNPPSLSKTSPLDRTVSSEPTGYVVANDADHKRAYMLVTQLRRLQSPSVFITSCDGQYFPILDDKQDRGTDREGMFDRVLCDVPCSGDGTVRKNPGIWKHWNQLGALALHPLQLSIVLRGARLTRVNGYIVYSTCSMNPIENEAVVAELLRLTEGSLVLEDPRQRMEGLLARSGWNSWKVLREEKGLTGKAKKDWKKKNNDKMVAKKKEWEGKRGTGNCQQDPGDEVTQETREPSLHYTLPYVPPDSMDQTVLRERVTSLGFVEYDSYANVEPEWRRRVRSSCFPPTEAEVTEFQLHKCLRCLPHDMDTGAFFVALFKKIKPLSRAATERMHQMARESRGHIDSTTVLEKGGDGEENEDDGVANLNIVDDHLDGPVTFDNPVTNQLSTTHQVDNDPINIDNVNVSIENEEQEPVPKAKNGNVGSICYHKKTTDLSKEDFISPDPSIWPPIIEQFGLNSTFPKEQFMVRAAGEAKILYFISKAIKKNLIDRGIQNRVTVINSGLKGFERCSINESASKYRISQEAIHFVVPHMTKRLLVADPDDFYKCIAEGFIGFDVFSEYFQRKLVELSPGSFVVALKGYEHDLVKKMYLVMWRRKTALNCFVSKVEMHGIFSKLRALGFVLKENDSLNIHEGVSEVAANEI